MPFQLLSIYQTIHKQFILKPNPYVTKEEAQSAYFKYTGFSWFAVSTAATLAMSAMRVLPRLTRHRAFSSLIILQFFTCLVFLGQYVRELQQLRRVIPQAEIQAKRYE